MISMPANNEFQEVDKLSLPKEKQTTLGLYVTASEAYEIWQKEPVKMYAPRKNFCL
jgi:hypothetical protein